MSRWKIDPSPDWKKSTPSNLVMKSNDMVGKEINLIRKSDFDTIPDGTLLYDIFGEPHIKGKDYIDQDTRGGYLAFGFKIE